MSAGLYGSAGGVNRQIKKLYVPVGGVNREIKELWAVKDGVNRKIFSAYDCQAQIVAGDSGAINQDGSFSISYPYYTTAQGTIGTFIFDVPLTFTQGTPAIVLNNASYNSITNSYINLYQCKSDGSFALLAYADIGMSKMTGNASATGSSDKFMLEYNINSGVNGSFYCPSGGLVICGKQIKNIEII